MEVRFLVRRSIRRILRTRQFSHFQLFCHRQLRAHRAPHQMCSTSWRRCFSGLACLLATLKAGKESQSTNNGSKNCCIFYTKTISEVMQGIAQMKLFSNTKLLVRHSFRLIFLYQQFGGHRIETSKPARIFYKISIFPCSWSISRSEQAQILYLKTYSEPNIRI